MRNQSSSWALLTLGLLSACGSKSSGSANGTVDATSITLQNFSTTAANAFCHALHDCCATAALVYNEAACTSQVTSYFETLAAPARTSRHITFDASAAAACVNGLRAREAQCADDFALLTGPTPLEPAPTACDAVFKGTVPPGGSCESYTECAPDPDPTISSSAACMETGTPDNRTCFLDRNVLDVGEPCSSPGPHVTNDCRNAYTSCVETVSKTCPATLHVGDACSQTPDLCDPSSSYCGPNSRCTALPGVDESCGSNLLCAHGLYCYGGSCKASNTPPPDGRCTQETNGCPLGQVCAPGSYRCIVSSYQMTTSSPTHLFDVDVRSCTLGPYADATSDGKPYQ